MKTKGTEVLAVTYVHDGLAPFVWRGPPGVLTFLTLFASLVQRRGILKYPPIPKELVIKPTFAIAIVIALPLNSSPTSRSPFFFWNTPF